MRDPTLPLRRALLVASWLLVVLQLAWLALWLSLADRAGDLAMLGRPPVIAYLALGPLAALAGAILAAPRPREAGWILAGGGIGTALAIWLGHVPDQGGAPALWSTSLVMVVLGAAWLALAAAQRRLRRPGGPESGDRR